MVFSEEFLNKIEYYECIFKMCHNRSNDEYGIPYTRIVLHFKSFFRRSKVIESEWMLVGKSYQEPTSINELRVQLARWFGNQTMKTVYS
jgi:hypothetical protein